MPGSSSTDLIDTPLGKIRISEHVPPNEIWVFNPPPVIQLISQLTMDDLIREYSKYWTHITNIGG
jgi:hypothetical protein